METVYELKDRLRVKVTDRCNMHCSFCHAEGARGVNDIALTDETIGIFRGLRGMFSRVHLTGGEPVLYPKLPELVRLLRSLDYRVSVTTNGYFDRGSAADILEGMSSINFSLHSLSEGYLKNVVADVTEYRKKITDNILYFRDKTAVSVNAVFTNDPHQHIEDIIDFCISEGVLLNLLHELNSPHLVSEKLGLPERGFEPVEKRILYPSSNTRLVFRDKAGHTIQFKEIEPFFPDFLCKGCGMKEHCGEGFAFVRLEGDPMKVRMCLDRKAVSYEEFRENYYAGLKALYEDVR